MDLFCLFFVSGLLEELLEKQNIEKTLSKSGICGKNNQWGGWPQKRLYKKRKGMSKSLAYYALTVVNCPTNTWAINMYLYPFESGLEYVSL